MVDQSSSTSSDPLGPMDALLHTLLVKLCINDAIAVPHGTSRIVLRDNHVTRRSISRKDRSTLEPRTGRGEYLSSGRSLVRSLARRRDTESMIVGGSVVVSFGVIGGIIIGTLIMIMTGPMKMPTIPSRRVSVLLVWWILAILLLLGMQIAMLKG